MIWKFEYITTENTYMIRNEITKLYKYCANSDKGKIVFEMVQRFIISALFTKALVPDKITLLINP